MTAHKIELPESYRKPLIKMLTEQVDVYEAMSQLHNATDNERQLYAMQVAMICDLIDQLKRSQPN